MYSRDEFPKENLINRILKQTKKRSLFDLTEIRWTVQYDKLQNAFAQKLQEKKNKTKNH